MAKKHVISENGNTDEWYGWIIVGSAFFIGFVTDGLLYSFGILLVELLEQFNQSRASTAVIGAAMTGSRFLIGPLAGALSDQYGCRVIVVVGAVISCIGFVISVFSTSVFYLCLSYGLLGGLGFGLMYLPSTVCVIQHFSKRRALATGVAACGSGVGMFVFNQLTRIMIDHYGWRGTLLLEAGITLQGAVLGLFLIRPNLHRNTTGHFHHLKESTNRNGVTNNSNYIANPSDNTSIEMHKFHHLKDSTSRNEVTNNSKNIAKSSDNTSIEMQKHENKNSYTENYYRKTELETQTSSPPVDINKAQTQRKVTSLKTKFQMMFRIDLLKDIRYWLFLVSAFVFQLAFTIPFNLIPDQAIESGMTKYEATWLSSSIGITNTISRVCIGWIGDWKVVNRMVLMEMLLLLAGVSTVASFFLATFQLKLIYTCLCGFLTGGYVTLCPVVLADLFGSEMIAKSFGLMMFFVGISGFLSTPIGGLLYDMTGNYDVTFVVAGAEFVVAGLLLVVVKLLSNKQTIQWKSSA